MRARVSIDRCPGQISARTVEMECGSLARRSSLGVNTIRRAEATTEATSTSKTLQQQDGCSLLASPGY